MKLPLLAALALAAAPALAQYKVVAPDGSITYTDRPPASANLRVTPLGRNAQATASGGDPSLPLELRQAAARYPCTFGHLFDGGYAAGYYGYAWAEVLSADAYGAFEEAGVFDPATGRRFREQILEVGGSRPALESFRAFRGREPRLDALLRHQGLA